MSCIFLQGGCIAYVCILAIPLCEGEGGGAFLVCCAARFLLAVGRSVLRRQNNVSARCLFVVWRGSGRYAYACGMPADKVSYAFDLPFFWGGEVLRGSVLQCL